jgi:hypothetical protein
MIRQMRSSLMTMTTATTMPTDTADRVMVTAANMPMTVLAARDVVLGSRCRWCGS